jgi:hypothetical protein
VAAAAAAVPERAPVVYATATQVRGMAPCRATYVARLSEYAAAFTDERGARFVLGDERGEQWVWHFVGALRPGQTYALPATFENYLSAPTYSTASQIAAMPACEATLAARSPCSSSFRTADGKWFTIGDPGSGAAVSQFIWSLADGQTCKLPEAFITYQKGHVKKDE